MVNQIKFNASDMAEYCKVLGKVINGKSMPIYECILFEPAEDHMRLYAGDSSTTFLAVDLDITCGVLTDKACIPFTWLKNLCDSNPCATITLSVDKDTNEISASTIDGVIKGIYQDADPFVLPESILDDYEQYTLNNKAISEAINQVFFAVTKDESRLVMTGVYLDYKCDRMLNVVATDGRMMAIKAIPSNDYEGLKIILPPNIAKLLPLFGDGCFTLKLQSGCMCEISFGDYTLYFRVIEGIYPNYNSVKPNLDNAFVGVCSRQALIAAIKRMSAFGNVSSGLAHFTFRTDLEGGLIIRAKDNDYCQSITEKIPCFTTHTKELTVGFSSKFALEILIRLNGNTVRIYTQAPDRPICFVGADENLFTLTMPMMIDDTIISDNPIEHTSYEDDDEQPAEEIEQPAEEIEQPAEEEQPEEESFENEYNDMYFKSR